MSKPVFHLQMIVDESSFTTISVFKQGSGKMMFQGSGRMLFKGDGVWQWGMGFTNSDGSRDHIRNHGKNICWAEWLHNGLEGMHTTILHTGDEFCVHEKHKDYEFVSQLWEFGLMSESEVLKIIGA